MKRIVFEGCTGWLHGSGRRTGVVLCAPPGHEGMWSYRGLRHLADDLAAADIPTLRFDYHGTGDAIGNGDEPACQARWIANILAAVAELRTRTGVSQVALCGLRLGASLAALAAEEMTRRGEPPAALVLLAPVVNGRAFLREMRALHVNWLNSVVPDLRPRPAPEGALDVLSGRFGADFVQGIETLRLDRQSGCPASHVLLFDQWPGTVSAVPGLAVHYEAAGARVDTREFEGYADMMRSAEYSTVPESAWRQVTGWLAALPVTEGERQNDKARPRVQDGHGNAQLDVDGALEQPIWLDGGSQFGVLSLPADGARARVAVIFPNTGGNHHIGDGRLFVGLSRRLARQGVAALRLDLPALGDSPRAHRTMNIPEIYSVASRAQMHAAVNWMASRGFERVVLAGVCSGAFLSLHAALANDKVCGLVLANLVKYQWTDADDDTHGKTDQPLRLFWHAALKPGNWQRLARGDIHPGRLLKTVARRIGALSMYHAGRLAARLHGGTSEAGELTTSGRSPARQFMAKLHQRGVRTELLYGVTDVGLEETAQCLGRNLEGLAGLSQVSVKTIECFDHSLFLQESRDNFCEHVVRHVEAQYAALERASQPEPVLQGA
ncbi:serine aminopeptidase domain-containing protein [Cupriavidus pauculus]|uniref:Alpha/beta hydrolase n=1 Tax=Cupriavidus pauculus TaxID=82633 RepID=A0A2N5C4A8_9BURK|nr:alpha/beta hydrolase [Cupriavidus pauculus]PLP97063.1 alpha/beta hydrolase [Cupriavidus pauculus]